MEKVILLKENEAKEIGCFLAMLQKIVVCDKSVKRDINEDLLEHYKKQLWLDNI